MAELEKVIKGLECCILRDPDDKQRCSECHYEGNCVNRLKMDALSLLKAQDAGWISVKDRLPEKQTPVLVYVPPYSDEDEEYIGHLAMAYYTYSVRGGYWAGTDGNIYGAIGIIHEPTHWLPLPEPPKEENT